MASFILYVNDGDGVSCGDAIPVCVTRKRVRNLNLRVRADGSVTLSIPLHATAGRAQAFLDGRSAWIRANVEKRRVQTQERELAKGRLKQSYPLWGRLVDAPAGNGLSDEQIEDIYRSELEQKLPEVIMWMESQIGAHANKWRLRSMKSRWGSCTPKTGWIRINTRLAAYPPECLAYVVAHELAHLLEPSHNARFHAIVARAIKDEKSVTARLRKPPVEKG